MKQRCFLVGIITFIVQICNGQAILDTVQISMHKTQSSIISLTDSTTLLLWGNNASLADLLAAKLGLHIQKSGYGSMSSLRYQGSGPSHSQILWNGFLINQATTGQTDISQLSVDQSTNVEIIQGLENIKYAGGAIGAQINMHQKPSFDITQEQAGASIISNSMGRMGSTIYWKNINATENKQFSVFAANDANRFKFLNTAQRPNIYQYYQAQNNQLSIQGLYAKKYNKWEWSFPVLIQNYNRQIAPAMTQVIANLSQKDIISRISSKFDYSNNKIKFYGGAAHFYEKTIFSDRSLPAPNKEKIYTTLLNIWRANAHVVYNIKNNWKLGSGSETNIELANLPDKQKYQQSNFGLYLHSKYYELKTGSTFEGIIRKDLHSLYNPKNSYGLHALIPWPIVNSKEKGRFFGISYSQNNRFASINETVGPRGIIRNLQPEKAGKFLVSLQYQKENSNQTKSLKFEFKAFASRIHNWIFWMPEANGIFVPINAPKVAVRGLENQLKYKFTLLKQAHELVLAYNLAKTNTLSRFPNIFEDQAVGLQMPYMPVHTFMCEYNIRYKNFILQLSQNMCGKRFTRTDNLAWLPAYQLSGARLGWSQKFDHHQVSLACRVENIFGYHYQMFAYFPMPTQNLTLNLQYSWI